MPNLWFRMYSEFSDDPKVQMMSEAMQRRLLMLLCERCKCETLHETERAFHWRVTETELAETKAIFMEKEFIDENWNLLNWNKRQFLSDSSTDRVRRHRQGLKQDETLQKRYCNDDETKCNVIDTDTDTDTEQKKTMSTPVLDSPTLSTTGTKTKPSPKAAPSSPVSLYVIPDWVPADPWKAWLKIRTKKRAANTDYALSLAVRELDKLRACGEDPEAVLNQAIMRSYTGLFPVHQNNNNGAHAPAPAKDEYRQKVDKIMAERTVRR